jgi:hypothetical protein
MTDAELTRSLERCAVPNDGFPHASHLRVAWVYLAESDSLDQACARMAATLRQFAASVGRAEKYHETMTLFWMRALAAARAVRPGATLDEVLLARPALLDKDLPLAYYSRERLFSEAARRSWLAPDRRPLEIDATSAGSAHSSRHAPDWALSR